MSLILASASPRRAELLQQIAVPFSVSPQALDESALPDEKPADYVLRLAQAKAEQCWALSDKAVPALGADTIVTIDGDLLGKPEGREAAIEMLLRLSGQTHEVMTGVAIVAEGVSEVVLSRSELRFCTISPAQAAAYWETGEPADKAGGYGIQGRGALFVEHLQGSYSAVVGLPLYETAQLLRLVGLPVLGGDE